MDCKNCIYGRVEEDVKNKVIDNGYNNLVILNAKNMITCTKESISSMSFKGGEMICADFVARKDS